MVLPPPQYQQLMGMHWLEMRDHIDGRRYGIIALQWNPGSRTWTHSNYHDTAANKGFNTENWRYIKPIPFPDIDE